MIRNKTILVVMIIVFVSGNLHAELFDNLVARWSLDENTDSNSVSDMSGNTHHGTATVNTSVLSEVGMQKTCFHFGDPNAIMVADDDAFSFGNGDNDSDFSIAAWIYVDEVETAQMIITKWGSSKEWAFYIYDSKELAMALWDDGILIKCITNIALTSGWHHVAMTYEGDGLGSEAVNRITLYVDSAAVAVTADDKAGDDGSYVSMVPSDEKVVIGAMDSENLDFHWNDKLDNVMLFSRLLTSDEVSTLSSAWPVADAGPDQTFEISTPVLEVTFDGSGSYDNDDPIASWEWKNDSGKTIANGEIATATLLVGEHEITLTVTDGNGLVDTDTVTIEINNSTDYNRLSIYSTEGGAVTDPGEGDFYYESGDVNDVNVVATAYENYEFVNWTIDATIDPNYTGGVSFNPNSAETTITMNTDYALIANFRQILTTTLTITSDIGGNVIDPNSGVSLKGVYLYNTGDVYVIDIEAVEDINYRFSGWTGTAHVENPSLPSTKVIGDINGDITLHANFIRQWELSVSSNGPGFVRTPRFSPFTCDEGKPINIIARPNRGNYYFINWTGDDADKIDDPLSSNTYITLYGDCSVTANFDEDTSTPYISSREPVKDKTEVPVNSMITITIKDDEKGVDPASVVISLFDPNDPDNIIYAYIDNGESYDSALGNCQRTGTRAAYTYYFKAYLDLQSDQAIPVTVHAKDRQNLLDETYSFYTATSAFGVNIKVNSIDDTGTNNVDTATFLSDGTIMAVWEQLDSSGNSDIYYGELLSGEETFGPGTNLTNDPDFNQINPVIDANETNTYIVWQQNEPNEPNEPSSIYVYTSANDWGPPVKITDIDNNTNQTNPAMAIDSTGKIYVTWLEENSSIQVSTSTDSAATWTESNRLIGGISSAQTQPAIAIDANDIAYIVWASNGDIYGATSGDNWGSSAIIADDASTLSNPVIAAEETGTILHLLWDDGSEVFHCVTDDGLFSDYTLTNITDASGAQTHPTIAVAGSKVFTAWKDTYKGNPDIYYAEDDGSSLITNKLVNDDGGTAPQFAPVINTTIINDVNVPYIAWVDGRDAKTSIYYARMRTFSPLITQPVTKNEATTVDASPNGILLTIPENALPIDTTFTISKVINPPPAPPGGFGLCYEFGPSGSYFTAPVTITISFTEDDWPDYETYAVYWYDDTEESEKWKTTGISDVEVNPTNRTVTFKTTHFTIFGTGGEEGDSESAVYDYGCSVSPYGEGSVLEFLLPYALIAIAVTVLKLKNKRKNRA